MLQSFRGTFDGGGIREIRIEHEVEPQRPAASSEIEFWVVINHEELPAICETIQSGNRIRALRLLSERAV